CTLCANLVQCAHRRQMVGRQISVMVEELEALVGYVFVVGGRAVSATPPGALVGLPPRRPQRGREQGAFVAQGTAAWPTHAWGAFYEQLAKLSADLYFHSGGGVTSGLREAISAVNSHLIEHNQLAGARYEANMICLVLRGHEVYLARTGSCIALLRQGATFVTFPGDLRDEYALNVLPLGYSPAPDIKLAHHEIAPGHVLVMSDAGFAAPDLDQLHTALGAGGVQSVIDALKPLGGKDAQAMTIEFVSTSTPDPVTITPQSSSKILRSSNAPAAVPTSSLPVAKAASTPVSASPPSASVKVASTPVKPVSKPSLPVRT